MNAEQERRLLELLDERDIREVLMRYCTGVDRCDRELIVGCFHPDALDDHGSWICIGSQIADLITQRLRPGEDSAMHFLGNVRVEVQGDTAFAESYLLAFRAFQKDAKPYTRTRALRFVDRLERRKGEWRISERVAVDDWNRVDEVVQEQPESTKFRYGSKNREDPVYAIRFGRVAREPGSTD